MQRGVFGRVHGLDTEKTGAGRAPFALLAAGLTHLLDPNAQADGYARQRMVGVEHHMLGVNIGHGKERIARRVRVASGGQGRAFDGQAHLQFGGKEGAGLQEQQLLVEVAKGLLRFDLQLHHRARAVALQRFLDGGQQIFAANDKLDRLV